jgi:DNA-binding transcriptional LysR family regulator
MLFFGLSKLNIGVSLMNDSNSRMAALNPQRPKLDLQQLRLAVIAADHGSFRRAAEACQIKQSSLSRAIRQLEHSLGISVFERSPGGIRPTGEGRQFLRIARSIAEQMDVLVDSTRANARGDAGRLAVGFCTSLTAGNLRASLLDFKQRFPQIALTTSERSRTRLATALRNSVLDILILAGDVPCPDFKVMTLWSERVLVVLQHDHTLTARDIIYWTDVRDQTVLLSQYDPGRELGKTRQFT